MFRFGSQGTSKGPVLSDITSLQQALRKESDLLVSGSVEARMLRLLRVACSLKDYMTYRRILAMAALRASHQWIAVTFKETNSTTVSVCTTLKTTTQHGSCAVPVTMIVLADPVQKSDQGSVYTRRTHAPAARGMTVFGQ